MSDPLAQLGADATLFAQKLDLLQQTMLLVRMSPEAYRAASFLDDRLLTREITGGWAHQRDVAQRLAGAAAKPIHFIFHAGHVGSTLVSRLLDETGRVHPLREPQTLRQLAEAHDSAGEPHSLLSTADFESWLDTQIALWRRGFAGADMVILKATSSAARLGPTLLARLPEARAIYLTLAPEPYLATLLAGANSLLDLRGMGGERVRRLTRRLGEAPGALHAMSLGELAAMTWLAERLTQDALTEAHGARVQVHDFGALLDDARGKMAAIAGHFGLAAPGDFFARLPESPVMTRYSKATEHPYSPALRLQVLAEARARHGAEIHRGLAWLERLARAHGEVAGVL